MQTENHQANDIPAENLSPVAAPPPAAAVVIAGERTEKEVQLEKELELERQARRKAEFDAGFAQDELRRLKDVVKPVPAAKKATVSKWTYFHGDN